MRLCVGFRVIDKVLTMDITSLTQRVNLHDRRNLYLAITAPIVAYSVGKLIHNLVSPPAQRANRIIRAPRESLQLLSAQDLEQLPYPPNALPGGRDVDTPYGNIRVYEWGPSDGRKVLFVHGISTPCIAFAGIAQRLVEEQGCRVMLFDLFGRGYSDTPDPTQMRQDARLFTSQMLLVLASSPLAWTGPEKFTLIGYSLGGCISVAFTSYFPHLVESLVLVAPAGLIRPYHISGTSKLLYGGLLPDAVVNYLIYRRLRAGGSPEPSTNRDQDKTSLTAVGTGQSETPGHPAHAADSLAPMFPNRPRISPAGAVGWQLEAHPGFCAAFISSIRYAPTAQQHESWRLIGRRQAASVKGEGQGLMEGKVLILLGEQDRVIISNEVEVDATEALGTENVEVVRLEGAHDVPITNARGCVDAISKFWE